MAKKLKEKNLNLIETYYRVPKSVVVKKPIAGKVIFMIILILALGGVSFYYLQLTVKESLKYTGLYEFVNNEDNLSKIELSETYLTQLNEANTKKEILTFSSNNKDNATKIDMPVFNKINSCLNENTSIEGLQYVSSGTFTVTIIANSVMECNAFVSRLDDTDMFKVTTYSGYSYKEEENVYMITVEFIKA